MKKLLLLVIVVTASCHSGFAQDQRRPFEDAYIIASAEFDWTTWEPILKKYNTGGRDIMKNIFIQAADLKKIPGDKRTGKNVSGLQSASLSSSFIPQSDAIDALGTFIAERFKQELNVAFLSRLRQALNDQEDLRTLLPNAYNFLQVNEPYNYTSFLEALRAAVRKDLQALPENGPLLLRAHHGKDLKLTDDKYVATMMGLEALRSYSQVKSSASIIRDVCKMEEIDELSDANLKSAVKLLEVFSGELYDEASRDWYSNEQLHELFNVGNLEFRRKGILVFLGLLYEKHHETIDPVFTHLSASNDETKILALQNYVNRINRSVQAIQTHVEELKELRRSGVELKKSDVLQYAKLTIDALQSGLDLSNLSSTSVDNNLINNYLVPAAKSSLAITGALQDGEYAEAFVSSVTLFTKYLPTSTFKKQFVTYGNFAVNIVTAENSEAMVSALENSALPVGSYKIKRESVYNISLNSYAGGFGGIEFLNKRGPGLVPADVCHRAGLAGFSAPVGVSFSVGTRRISDKEIYPANASWSLFISAIDIGAVTSFRLTNDKTTALPETSFKNIIAPGAYIIRGMRNIPLSWGVGAQYGPQTRKISDLDTEADFVSSLSTRLFLTVDIPLINFFTKGSDGHTPKRKLERLDD